MPFLRAMCALLISVAAAVLAIGTPAAGAAPGATAGNAPSDSIGIRLLDATESLKDDPRAQQYIIDNLPPGTTITRHLMISNNTSAPATIDVYAGPATIVDGVFSVADRGEQSMLTSWISLDQSTVRLESGQESEVAVTITVPEDAPEVEQYAAIWASTQADRASADGVTSVSRVGVRVYLSVGPGNGPPADFTIKDLTPQRGADGSASVVAAVTNTGGRAVDLSGKLNLGRGPGGLTAEPINADLTTIAPGEDGKVVFAVPNSTSLPAGPWNADVKLQSGLNKHDMSATITFPDKGVGDSVGDSNSKSWPLVAGIVLALVAVAGGITYLLVRKRRSPGTE